jgi:hypothetical protein
LYFQALNANVDKVEADATMGCAVSRTEDSERISMSQQEPAITINGKPLTVAQATTLRVAIGHFASCLSENGLGDDDHGRSITSSYIKRAAEIEALMLTASS